MGSKDIFVQHSSRKGSPTEVPQFQGKASLSRQSCSFQVELNPRGRLILLAELIGCIPEML